MNLFCAHTQQNTSFRSFLHSSVQRPQRNAGRQSAEKMRADKAYRRIVDGVNRGHFLQLCCAQQEVEEERARPVGDSPTSLHPSRPVYSARPIYATWLFCSVDGEVVRRVMRLAFAHACPHQMPTRGATATITNVNATACCIVSSPCMTSAVWGRAGTVRTKKCVGLHPSSPPHTTCTIGEENPPHHPTFDFSANARGTSA